MRVIRNKPRKKCGRDYQKRKIAPGKTCNEKSESSTKNGVRIECSWEKTLGKFKIKVGK